MKFLDEGLILRKEELAYREWNSEVREYSEQPLAASKMPGCAWNRIAEIADDFTLGDLLRLMEPDAETWEILTGEDVVPVITEGLYGKAEEEGAELDYLVLQRFYEERSGKLSCSWHFSGYGKAPDNDPYVTGEYTYWAIGLSPINTLANLPLRVNTEVELPGSDKPLEQKVFTLLELVREIFWELTFYGTPEERDAKASELQGIVEEIKDGTAKLIP